MLACAYRAEAVSVRWPMLFMIICCETPARPRELVAVAVAQLVKDAALEPRFGGNSAPKRRIREGFSRLVAEDKLVAPSFRQALQLRDRGTGKPGRDRVAVLGVRHGERSRDEIQLLSARGEKRADAEARVIGHHNERRHLAPVTVEHARDRHQAHDFIGAEIPLGIRALRRAFDTQSGSDESVWHELQPLRVLEDRACLREVPVHRSAGERLARGGRGAFASAKATALGQLHKRGIDVLGSNGGELAVAQFFYPEAKPRKR
jgi:hypothetical protein